MNSFESAMKMALNAAQQFQGATAPNPPVGAIALNKQGKVLLGAAHQRAGLPHAEAKVLELAEKLGKLSDIHTLVVTLEPCNHQGLTPPCTEAILRHKQIRRVVIGSMDPNPNVAGGGIARLQAGGVEVVTGVLEAECDFLIRSFRKAVTQKRPWVTLKTALDPQGSMIPPAGQRTFTSKPALIFAHELRKRADALWTGSGTVLADSPLFTVRWVPDHLEKKRHLLLSDRRKRIPQAWIEQSQENGFLPQFPASLEEGLDFLGQKGALEVLVEAGPELREAWLKSGLWDEHVVISQGQDTEEITIHFREEEACSQES